MVRSLSQGLGLLAIVASLSWGSSLRAQPSPLEPLPLPLDEVLGPQGGCDRSLWETPSERVRLIRAIGHSLRYLDTEAAASAYATYPVAGITHRRVRRSLVRFRQLLYQSRSFADFQQALQQEFMLYRSVGQDGAGTVLFTGYFQPTYAASRVPTADYRYPLYRRPADLEHWPTPHPTRLELEGSDGLQGSQGPLAGLELVWLRERLEAFLIHVQGSARLQLPNGEQLSVGYAGRTDYNYTSIGRELINDSVVAEADLSLPVLLDYFQRHPEALDHYLPRNRRFIFFQETAGGPPLGSLNVPVTAGRSIATDKALMPPGALALIRLPLPQLTADGYWRSQTVDRCVLDQDTGGAIQGAGRVDVFLGTGFVAGEQAGRLHGAGELYYLLLRESP
ncbi:Membrane-bound lytic murein transglycosylase A [Halomicronema hongdechloris C2206]|uniref:peptidoglycan lytic exotransglycosylase n=1 Tax=Halomicronema hongdechloris C2206 TaxID=1641165 RepID=A0A1Z3HGF4_9CYAN|nr:MltA domain-containing protein [Halomicronema hongdechloris]ASC69372.1 Membrane-bound lytic murein transglycosylase A [Halomicronema hongdechloris C2206]